MRIAYLVHDLADAAVARRVRMLHTVQSLVLIGFSRRDRGSAPLLGRPVIPIGRTKDASFVQRVLAIGRALLSAGRWRAQLSGADLVVARQLEMLALAVLTAPRGTRIAYECLDIHRLMLGRGLVGRTLRLIERALMRRCALMIVSSEGFVDHYFTPMQGGCPPLLLLENKVLEADFEGGLPWLAPGGLHGPTHGPPWRIGWFGVLRCRRSLLLLSACAARWPGRLEIVLRGRPSLTAIPDFDALIAASPGLRFAGPYDRSRDLPRIYAEVHYVWAIDFFEDPGNSQWLLPNRLYEGGAMGCVPIALQRVQTGRWLARHGCGVLLGDDLAGDLDRLIGTIDPDSYRAQRKAVADIDRSCLVDDAPACAAVVQRLRQGSPAGSCPG